MLPLRQGNSHHAISLEGSVLTYPSRALHSQSLPPVRTDRNNPPDRYHPFLRQPEREFLDRPSFCLPVFLSALLFQRAAPQTPATPSSDSYYVSERY